VVFGMGWLRLLMPRALVAPAIDVVGAFTARIEWRHHRRRTTFASLNMATRASSSTGTNGAEKDKKATGVQETIAADEAEYFRKKREPAFPRRAYPLLKDEREIKHNFISFIDQSMFSEYSQTVRLVEPRLYARPDQFRKENLGRQPTIKDVAEPATCRCCALVRSVQSFCIDFTH